MRTTNTIYDILIIIDEGIVNTFIFYLRQPFYIIYANDS